VACPLPWIWFEPGCPAPFDSAQGRSLPFSQGAGAGIVASAFLYKELSHRAGGEAHSRKVVGGTLFDPGHEFRGEALDHLPDARPKLVK
jgi:hypothetical protein